MPTQTPVLGLQQAVSTDDNPTYLVTSLAASLGVLDGLFSNTGTITLINPYTQPIIATPTTFPPAGTMRIYPKADGEYYKMTEAGVEAPLAPPGLTLPLTEHLTFSPHMTWDIGAFGSNGPRDIYAGRSILTGPNSYVGFSNNAAVLRQEVMNGTLAMRNPASGALQDQNSKFNLYQRYIDAANYSRATLGWANGRVLVGAEAAGTGVLDDVQVQGQSVFFYSGNPLDVRWNINDLGHLLPKAGMVLDIGSALAPVRDFYLGGLVSQTEQAVTPATLPTAGAWQLYPKADGYYQRDDAGVETPLAGAASTMTDPFPVGSEITFAPTVGGVASVSLKRNAVSAGLEVQATLGTAAWVFMPDGSLAAGDSNTLADLGILKSNPSDSRGRIRNLNIAGVIVAGTGMGAIAPTPPLGMVNIYPAMAPDGTDKLYMKSGGGAVRVVGNELEVSGFDPITANPGIEMWYDVTTAGAHALKVRHNNAWEAVGSAATANLLTNGGFEVWQRGFGPFTTNGTYWADRWTVVVGAGGSTIAINADAGVVDAGSSRAAKVDFVAVADQAYLRQFLAMADGPDLRGKTISFSARVVSATAGAVKVRLATDGTTAADAESAPNAATGTWETLAVTITVPVDATFVVVDIYPMLTSTFHIDNAMLVVGSAPADYAPLLPADELARCQRYYEKIVGPTYWSVYDSVPSAYMVPIWYKVTKSGATTLTIFGPWSAANVTVPPAVHSASDNACTVVSGVITGPAGGWYGMGDGNSGVILEVL